jgi:cation:H+ antiporter
MNDYFVLALGVVCAGIGGELFVRGVVGIALWARISAGIVGATVAAFATSSPELSVAIISAMAKKPDISLGAALGSNVVNVALILAIPVVMTGIKSSVDSVQRDFPFALFAPMLTAVLALDGELSRLDGALLLAAFIFWLGIVTVEVRRQRSAAEKVLGEKRGWLAMLLSLAGFLCLIAAGRFIVTGATGIALSFGIDEFIIGATIVAIGTSIPELATCIISKIRGHDEVGVGTILGSNIFNGLFIIAVTALICPIKINLHEVLPVLAFGLITVILIWPPRHGYISRGRGVLLLALYAVYVVVVIN